MTYRSSYRRALAAVMGIVSIASAPALGQVSPEETLKSFELADGLEASVWATEPMLVNPTNIDIDARGRVWVCEGANYRRSMTRPEGDRIVILEDTDHDGKADSQKVFAQDPSLSSPLGIAVLGNKVYVSQSPSIVVYTIDESGDKPLGKPQVWMTGFEGVNHDHGVHAIVFGPDGRFYFNAGNNGCEGKEPFKLGNGEEVVDSTASHVPRGKLWRGAERPPGTLGYMEGMAFRCNPDGSRFETLGHNFRNNYELAVDSFGTVWQSDNDDDGNEGVRINYVMEGGNFGYKGPQGYDWGRDRAAFPDQSRQEAHWHQRWPGVVPNVLHTGVGSPTGIVVYEGELLPEKFRGAVIHCDPGPNVVRAYLPKPSAQVPVEKFDQPKWLKGPDREGAGYKVDVVNIVKGKDKWFRPSDVCVAPDGSLFIADWYDPGVGGHATGDKPDEQNKTLRGRIYRVAPKGHKVAAPKLDLSTIQGQIAALKSPNLATRCLAFTKLAAAGDAAQPALADAAVAETDPRYIARLLWLLVRSGDDGSQFARALSHEDPNIRITELRAMRAAGRGIDRASKMLVTDPSPAVRRELALAMNYEPVERAVPILVQLANQFDGEDRWYLEALGIGATGKENEVLAAWEKDGTNKSGKAGELIRWRLKKELPTFVRVDEKTRVIDEWWAVGPFDVDAKDALDIEYGPDASPAAIDVNASFKGIDGKPLKWERIGTKTFEGVVLDLKWIDFKAFCEHRGERSEKVAGYFAATIVSPLQQPAKLLLGSNDTSKVWLNGKQVWLQRNSRDVRWADDIIPVKLNRGPNVLLVKLHQKTGNSGLLVAVAGEQQKPWLSNDAPGAPVEQVTQSTDAAASTKPGFMKDGSPLPPIEQLVKESGDPKAGEAVFANTAGANCISCHQIGDKGQMLGPPLQAIGQKLTKPQLYEAILKPNAGILMGYESWVVRTKKGETITGLKTSDTPDRITIKDTAGKYHDIAVGDIARQAKQKISIMPENLENSMTRQELVDLVEYLSTLKSK